MKKLKITEIKKIKPNINKIIKNACYGENKDKIKEELLRLKGI